MEPYEESISNRLDPDSLLPRNDGQYFPTLAQETEPEESQSYQHFREEIEKFDNLEIWLGATASGFEFDLASGKIKALTARSLAGQTLRVAADEYLVAAGTLESTRLLLLADRQANHAISMDCDALGRYFNDHLGLIPATLRPLKRTLPTGR